MTVIGLIKIDSCDRDEDLIRIFDSGHSTPAPFSIRQEETVLLADVDRLLDDLRDELREFRTRVPHRVMQSRPLDG